MRLWRMVDRSGQRDDSSRVIVVDLNLPYICGLEFDRGTLGNLTPFQQTPVLARVKPLNASTMQTD